MSAPTSCFFESYLTAKVWVFPISQNLPPCPGELPGKNPKFLDSISLAPSDTLSLTKGQQDNWVLVSLT